MLRHAEQLARRGSLDEAVAAYTELLDLQPRDWNCANRLGDLLVQTGDTRRAIRCFSRAAEVLAADGFAARACALYKKILKLEPGADDALMRAGELSAGQGLVAEARALFEEAANRRRRSGDDRGALEAILRIAALDPENSRQPRDEGELPRAATANVFQPPAGPTVVDAAATLQHAVTPTPGGGSPSPSPLPPLSAPPSPPPAAPVAASPAVVTPAAAPAAATDAAPQPSADIEEVFARLRREAVGGTAAESAEIAYTRGVAFLAAGDVAGAIEQLRVAARSTRYMFPASLRLAHIFEEQRKPDDALQWLEYALDAAELTDAQRCQALGRLARLLEQQGETARALAACLELQTYGGSQDDLEQRIARLTRAQVGG